MYHQLRFPRPSGYPGHVKLQRKSYQNSRRKVAAQSLVQWCKQVIPKLATLSSPLKELLRKDTQYIATEEHHAVFEGIKKALMSSPLFRYAVYDSKAQFVIQTNASTTAIGAILYQEKCKDQ
uniref:Reverse transcriptase/retrotransposon-derived protein RNase H-like domain-containing protein n=1 Tax=Romanomermis culicivorax TaxID=13658 RepID=A0A915HTW7_ROMCU